MKRHVPFDGEKESIVTSRVGKCAAEVGRKSYRWLNQRNIVTLEQNSPCREE
jgi:hypothetical protein